MSLLSSISKYGQIKVAVLQEWTPYICKIMQKRQQFLMKLLYKTEVDHSCSEETFSVEGELGMDIVHYS